MPYDLKGLLDKHWQNRPNMGLLDMAYAGNRLDTPARRNAGVQGLMYPWPGGVSPSGAPAAPGAPGGTAGTGTSGGTTVGGITFNNGSFSVAPGYDASLVQNVFALPGETISRGDWRYPFFAAGLGVE